MQGVTFVATRAGRGKVARHVARRTALSWRYDFRTPVRGYVPFAPDDDFIGRKDDLLSIYLGLIGQLNKVAVSHLGVVGMGGVGKTALAIEFAHRFGAAFDGVYWVQGQSLAELLAELVRLARDRLRLAIDDPHGADANGRYLLALAAHARAHPQMLLIIDNVAVPPSLVTGRFPRSLSAATSCSRRGRRSRSPVLPRTCSRSFGRSPRWICSRGTGLRPRPPRWRPHTTLRTPSATCRWLWR